MKAQILKIAGVKSEKEFYKKYPSEEAFMKMHGKAFKKAQTGYAIQKAQFGNMFSGGFNPGNTSLPSGGINTPNAQAFGNQMMQGNDSFGMKNYGDQFAKNNPLPQGVHDYGVPEDIGSKFGKDSSGLSASMIPGMIDQGMGVYNAFQAQNKQKKSLQQQGKLLGLTETLSKSDDRDAFYQQHINDRPENYMASTNMFHPAQGTGYDILRSSRDGGYIKAQTGEDIETRPGGMMGREQIIPEEDAEMPIQAKPSNFDSKSARDNWVQKTGLPWSEAKRLGYTSGSAKDNTKLLGELNDPRFRKENLRTSAPKSGSQSRTPVQHRETPTGKLAPIKPQSYAEAMKGKPKYKGTQSVVQAPNEGNMLTRIGERLANPMQTLGEYSKYGELPAEGFSKNSKNAYDQVLGLVNPAYWANAAGNAMDYAEEGEYGKAAFEAADALPALGKLKYTKYVPYEKGLPAAREFVRRAGYLGEGAKRLGAGPAKQLAGKAPKQIAPSYVPNFTMYQNGGPIGGNPTEVQNTYSPYDLYTHGGFQPMDDSNKVKQFQFGGAAGGAISQGATDLIGAGFNNNAGYQAGAFVGQFSDAIIPGSSMFVKPILGAIGGGLDQAFGDAGKINKLTQQNQGKQDRIMDNSAWKNTGFAANRQEGGYLNPEYNPQLITMFGDHDAEDFADYANKFRAGGHLKEYTPPSERAMETYADGGELKTHWGGEVEPVSYNPYSEGEGLTYNAYGNSHFEKDEQGRTGIGLSIMKDGGDMGDEPDVEIETNEPISMTGDGAVVYGNLNTNKDMLEQFQLPEKYANRKVKHIVNDIIVPKEQKYTKELERITNDVPSNNTKFGALGDKTREVQALGLHMNLKQLAKDKKNLAAYQDHIHQTTDSLSELLGKEVSQEKFARNGEVSHILAKGEISQNAKNGKTLYKAASGTTTPQTTIPIGDVKSTEALGYIPTGQHAAGKYYGKVKDQEYETLKKNNPWFDWDNFDPSKKGEVQRFQNEFNVASKLVGSNARLTEDDKLGEQTASAKIALKDKEVPPAAIAAAVQQAKAAPMQTAPIQETPKAGFPWGSAISSLARGLYPAFNMPIGSQINPELYAMADNNAEGLSQPHMYSMLKNPFKYSADRDKNAILSQARQASRSSGNNPAAQAAIMAQVADAMSQVSSREGDINQQTYQGVYNDNIGTINQDRARNLGIDMDSAMKLAQAKSNTKAQKLAAMTSAEAKIAANKRENMEYNIGMAEHPDYTFGPDGRIIKLPRYVEFDTTGKGIASGTKGKGLASGKEFSYDDEGNIIGVHSKGKDDKAKNGKSIKAKNMNGNVVRAFKGF
jgi:hypothetical protein